MFPYTIHFSILNYPIEIGVYGLFFFTAVLAAMTGCFFFAVQRGFEAKKIALVLAVMVISAVAGARVLNALVNFSAYAENPGKLFEISASGFSLYGGIFFALVSGVVCCRLLRLDAYRLGDSFIPFLGISIAIMRIGCFCRGCCFGVETDLPWGVKFPMLSPAHLQQMSAHGNYFEVDPVHPTQLYELAAALCLSIITFLILKKKQKNGTAMLFFLAGFSLFRLLNSYFRVNPDTFTASPYFYPILYMAIAAVCVFLMIRLQKKGFTANSVKA